MRPFDQDQQNDGESYEFSFRPGYGTRLFVHVSKASLEILRSASELPESPLQLLLRYNGAICALAVARSRVERTTRVVVTESDAASILAGASPAGSSRMPPVPVLARQGDT
jgi:hypothetical protein